MKTVAIISLTLNLGVIGIGLYGYLNKDKVINIILDKVKGEIPSLVKDSMPSLPTTTGFPKL